MLGVVLVFTTIALQSLRAAGPTITVPPRDTQIQWGETAVLQVTATPQSGVLKYQWYKDGVPITGTVGETLTIPNCNKTKTGYYHVMVSDASGSAPTQPVTLYVIEPIALRYRMAQQPESGTGKITDATGNTAGTIIGQPLPTLVRGAAPYKGNGWDFFGKMPTAYLSIPVKNSLALQNFGNLENSTGMTISFWYNFDIKTRPYLSGRVLSSLGEVFKLDFCFDIASTSVQLNFGDGKLSPLCKIATDSRCGLLNGGEWHHYAFVLDYRNPVDEKGSPINNVVVFVDGKPSKGYPAPGPQTYAFQGPFMPKPEDALVLGSKINPVQSIWGDFMIFNYPLSQNEIQQLCTTGGLRAFAPQIIVQAGKKHVLAAQPTVDLTGKIFGFGQNLPLKGKWSVKTAPEGAVVSFKNPTAINTAATLGTVPGKYVLQYEASNTVWTSQQTVLVEVHESIPLTAYASVAGKPEADALTGAQLHLNGAARTMDAPNAARITYAWIKESGPGEPSFSNPTDPNTMVKFSVPGTYVLALNAVTGTSKSSAKVTVRVADALVESVTATASPQLMTLSDKSAKLSGKVVQTKPDASMWFSWSKVSGPGEVSFSDTNAPETSATFSASGVYQFRFSTSGAAGAGTADVWVNIWPDPLTPVTDQKIRPPVPRQLTPQPPPYVHPRYLFTSADWEELSKRAQSDPVASAAIEKIRADLKETIYNPNSGLGMAYQKMLSGDRQFTIQAFRKNSGLYTKLAEGCYIAWLDKDDAAMRNLATVVANSARDELTWNQDEHGQSASIDFAVCYDLAFNEMSEDQRVDCRSLLSRMTKGCRIGTFHWDYLDPWFSMPLAFYKETGYDEETTRLNFDSIKYAFDGWTTSPGGWKLEDTAYGGFTGWSITLHAVPFSRQFEPLHVTGGPARETLMEFYLLYPDVTATSESPRMGGFSERGWPNSGQEYLMQKYFYPTDPLDDLIRRVNRNIGRGGSLLNEAIFGLGPLAEAPTFASVAAFRNLPLTRFDPQRGVGVARSDWGTDAAKLDFDCRFDTFASGHIHGNRNDFALFGLGREWVVNPGYGEFPNELHASVLIDGKGSARSPGRFLDVIDQKDFTLFAGDAKVAYDYSDIIAPSPTKQNDSAVLPLIWKDLLFPGSSDGVFPPLSPAPYRFIGNQDNEEWINYPLTVRVKNGELKPYNPVKKAFRSAMLIRGERPYVIVIDDIQKDDQPHEYAWTVHVPQSLELAPIPSDTEAILYHKSDGGAAGSPQCLVRVLQGEGQAAPFVIKTTPDQRHKMFLIPRTTVAPNYKVLLFPHHNGEPLPKTSMKDNVLTVVFPSGQTDSFTFEVGKDGRTRVRFQRGTKESDVKSTTGSGNTSKNISTTPHK